MHSFDEEVRFFQADDGVDRLTQLEQDFLTVYNTKGLTPQMLLNKGWTHQEIFDFLAPDKSNWLGRLLIYLGIELYDKDQDNAFSLEVELDSIDDVYTCDNSLFLMGRSRWDLGFDVWHMIAKYYDLEFEFTSREKDLNIYINTDLKRQHLTRSIEMRWRDPITGLKYSGCGGSGTSEEVLWWMQRYTSVDVTSGIFGDNAGNIVRSKTAFEEATKHLTLKGLMLKYPTLDLYEYQDLDSLRYLQFDNSCLESYGEEFPFHYTKTQKRNL